VKTDTLFYQLFQNFPSIFFELIGESTADTAATSSLRHDLMGAIAFCRFSEGKCKLRLIQERSHPKIKHPLQKN
jgi:hypothetical protein